MNDLNSWREAARHKVSEIGQWLGQRALPVTTYGALVGLSLWPLVQTAVATGQLAPVLGTLYALGANVGVNLVANQIEQWKSQSPDPAEVIRWVDAQLQANQDEFRGFAAALTDKLETIAKARESLPADQQAAFMQQLNQQMASWAASTRPNMQVTVGSGAAAIGDGSTAVGQNATFVKGNVSGNVITGSGNTISSASLNPEAQAIPPSLTRLHHNLLNAFNQDELETLCLELGIDHESLRGQSKSQLARSLVLHCHHHGRVAELRAKGQNLRSHLAWE